jgi:Fe-Mn family superoxide dismutase
MSTIPRKYSRRDLFGLAIGAALLPAARQSLAAASSATTPAPTAPYTLPPLPYAYDALEPHMDAETMRIHHDKHHRAYVDNANRLLAPHPELAHLTPEELIARIAEAPEDIRQGLINNVGGHINHSQFWRMMKPQGGGPPTGPVAEKITAHFGSFDAFRTRFDEAALGIFGSGWAWLVQEPDGRLSILPTPNQDPPSMHGRKALLGLDVWEHAYYLKHQNRRAGYVQAWWNTVNWDEINARLAA